MTVQPGTDLATIPTDYPSPYLLTHADRCDSCGARAYVHVILHGGGELYWCRHDWLKHQHVLQPLVAYTNDETRALFNAVKDDGWVVPGKEVSLPPRKQNP